jgi:hypothetical protein
MPKKIPPIPAAEKLQYRKNLSAPGLLSNCKYLYQR